MKLELKDIGEQGDFKGMCLDIIPQTSEDYFELGLLFGKLKKEKKCAWQGMSFNKDNDVDFIRLPIFKADDLGFPIIDLKENNK